MTDIEKMEEWTPNEWDILVRQEIMDHLDMFLPYTKTFNIGTKYTHPVVGKMEDGVEVTDKEKVSGVQLILDFNFINAVKLEK